MILLEYVSKCGIDDHFKNIFNYKQDIKDGGVSVDFWIIKVNTFIWNQFQIKFILLCEMDNIWNYFWISGLVTYTSTNSLPMNPSFPQDDINKKFTLVRK